MTIHLSGLTSLAVLNTILQCNIEEYLAIFANIVQHMLIYITITCQKKNFGSKKCLSQDFWVKIFFMLTNCFWGKEIFWVKYLFLVKTRAQRRPMEAHFEIFRKCLENFETIY